MWITLKFTCSSVSFFHSLSCYEYIKKSPFQKCNYFFYQITNEVDNIISQTLHDSSNSNLK